jgi:hypothetical protein
VKGFLCCKIREERDDDEVILLFINFMTTNGDA